MPISMLLTEWHFVLLYEDRIRVIGLLSDEVVYEEALDLVSIQSTPSAHCTLTFPLATRILEFDQFDSRWTR